MLHRNNFKNSIKNRTLIIGSWVTIGEPSIIEILSTADFEWIGIDLEHTAIDFVITKNLISTAQGLNMSAIVRVGKNDELIIKRVMDSGADGIIVPMIKNRTEAIDSVNYLKYPPIGKRGIGIGRGNSYGTKFDEYRDWVENEAVLIIQIEHIESVRNIDEILDVSGIDAILIGPYDLSGSMGFPGQFHREDVKQAIDEVIKKAKSKNIPFGFHIVNTNPEETISKIESGANFVAYGTDFSFLGDIARNGMKTIKANI